MFFFWPQNRLRVSSRNRFRFCSGHFIGRIIGRIIGCIIGRIIGRIVCRIIGRIIGRIMDRIIGHIIGRITGRNYRSQLLVVLSVAIIGCHVDGQ